MSSYNFYQQLVLPDITSVSVRGDPTSMPTLHAISLALPTALTWYAAYDLVGLPYICSSRNTRAISS